MQQSCILFDRGKFPKPSSESYFKTTTKSPTTTSLLTLILCLFQNALFFRVEVVEEQQLDATDEEREEESRAQSVEVDNIQREQEIDVKRFSEEPSRLL